MEFVGHKSRFVIKWHKGNKGKNKIKVKTKELSSYVNKSSYFMLQKIVILYVALPLETITVSYMELYDYSILFISI